MELEPIRLFVKVVQLGSYSKASELLRIPKSTVSRAVSRLEQECQTKLLIRTTRNMTLTAAGRMFFERCFEAIQTIEDARKSLNGQDAIIAGLVRITAPEDFGMNMAKVVSELAKSYSGLLFELKFTNELIDLVQQGFDLAIRVGKLNSSSLKVKKIGEMVMVPVASPNYLQKRAKIKNPRDIALSECLTIQSQALKTSWTLYSSLGKKETIDVKPKVISNQMFHLIHFAIQGVGIAFVPLFLCQTELKAGHLIRVLPEWHGESFPVSIVSPLSFSSSSKLSLVSNHLVNSIQKILNFK